MFTQNFQINVKKKHHAVLSKFIRLVEQFDIFKEYLTPKKARVLNQISNKNLAISDALCCLQIKVVCVTLFVCLSFLKSHI